MTRRAPVLDTAGEKAVDRPKDAGPRGTVKWYDTRKGFGFISRHDADDLFVHRSAIEGVGAPGLEPGQLVAYEVGEGRKGDEARSVRLLVS